ncbi:MAG TPA: hypothetical protein VFU88_05290 [Ktedonobacterales bacterium]|nr:hypothetical protein [Ktedonobacterales bacterium]
MLTQHGGRPSLRRLDWGYPYMDSGAWSPDGRWVSAHGGSDYLADNPVVVSADGRTRHTLTSWHCGLSGEFDFVWSPDGRLGCIVANDLVPGTKRLCLGQPPSFASCQDVRLPQEVGRPGFGSTWSADGQTLWITAIHDYSADQVSDEPDLFVVTAATGALVQVFPFVPGRDGGAYLPQWVPQHQALSYEVGLAGIEGPGQLVMSTVTRDADGQFVLGPRTVLASDQTQDGYAWSPSGHWVAVRHVNPDHGDKIYLVNADDPSVTLDVTHAEDVGQMLDPVWSPDGQTLVVFGVDDERPYAIDIASYLASKGLQP